MKIVISGINFSPELTGIGKYSGEMASWLVAQGHYFRVVTAPPCYLAWQVGSGYSAGCYSHGKLAISPATPSYGDQPETQELMVHRCPLWVPSKPSGLKRQTHLASFVLSSLPIMLRQVFWKPYMVWMVAPAFFCAPGRWLTAKPSGAPAWIHVQDFEVDAAFDLGLLKGKLLRRMVLAVERWMFLRFDVVSPISHRMLEGAADKGVAANRLVLFPNWVGISSVRHEMRCDDLTFSSLSSDVAEITQRIVPGYLRMALFCPARVSAVLSHFKGYVMRAFGFQRAQYGNAYAT